MWLGKKPTNPFSYRIAEWSYGISNNFPVFSNIHWDGYPDLYKIALQSIAFMNIKKSGGGGSSNKQEVEKHFSQNKGFLLKQINIINPDIIIWCLKNWVSMRKQLFEGVVWKNCGYRIPVGLWQNKKIIDFYHPSSRNAPAASYSLLQNVVQSKSFQKL